ncbi:MAG: S-layer homology domain-containing protein [Ruminococcaceae bacterium]|nr:S-layer homology domain-containing protein [Oscillospiraceae bacterium]
MNSYGEKLSLFLAFDSELCYNLFIISEEVSYEKNHQNACCAVAFGISLTAFALTPESAATDLGKYGIMNGFPDGSHRLETNVTRAQIAKMVITAMGREKLDPYAGADRSMFRDMEKTHWAYSCVSEAFMCKIVSGFPDSTFRPDDNVTYEQALKIMVCVLRYDRYELQSRPEGSQLQYPQDYIKLATELGLTEGLTFEVGKPATRGFVATMISRALDIPLVVPFVTPETANKPILGKEFVYEIMDGTGQGEYTTLRTNLDNKIVTLW